MAWTRDQIVDRILGRLVRTGEAVLQPAVVEELNLAQQYTLERGYPKPWFLLNITTTTVDATGYKAATPASFIELYEEGPALMLVSDEGDQLLPLEKTDRATLELGVSSPNTESAYTEMEGYFLFATQLTVGATIRVLYYKAEPLNEYAYGAGSQPAANRWIQYAADLLIAKVGLIMAGMYIRDKESVDFFDAMHTQAQRRIVAENAGRKEAARERFLNGAVYPVLDAPRTTTSTT